MEKRWDDYFFFQYGKGKVLNLLAPWNLWHHLRRGFLRAKQILGQRVSWDATPALAHAPVPTSKRRAIPWFVTLAWPHSRANSIDLGLETPRVWTWARATYFQVHAYFPNNTQPWVGEGEGLNFLSNIPDVLIELWREPFLWARSNFNLPMLKVRWK